VAYSDVILAEASLVAYWRLGTGSTDVDDASGNGHGFTKTGTPAEVAGLLPAESDTARDLPGSVSHYYEAADHADFDFLVNAPYSIEAWVNFHTIDTLFRRIIQHHDGTNGWGLLIHGPGGPNLYVSRQAGGVETISNFTTPSAGVTYHVVGTYDGTNQRLYINGSLVDTDASAGSIGAVATGVRTGFGGGGDYVDGVLDEVAVYSAALTHDEVVEHYAAGTNVGFRFENSKFPKAMLRPPVPVRY